MPLKNCRILIVEDEFMLAQHLQWALEDAGAVVLGPAPSVECALASIAEEDRIDAVVLDLNLGGELAYPVADDLISKQIPFVFSSGYEDEVVKTRYPGIPNCTKPFVARDLLRSLKASLH